jgi:hypothetical protein
MCKISGRRVPLQRGFPLTAGGRKRIICSTDPFDKDTWLIVTLSQKEHRHHADDAHYESNKE